MRFPFTLLAEVPEKKMWIAGDNNGNILMVTDEFKEMTAPELWGARILAPNKANVLSVVIAPYSEYSKLLAQSDTDILETERENIEISKVVIQDRFALMCGFGKRSKKWVVRGELIRKPKD